MFRRPPHATRALQHVHQVLVEIRTVQVVIALPKNVLGRYVCHRGAECGTQVQHRLRGCEIVYATLELFDSSQDNALPAGDVCL